MSVGRMSGWLDVATESHGLLNYQRVLHRPDREAVEPIVVVGWIDSRRIEVQVVAVRLRVERRAPVVPVRASVVEPRTVAVARGGEEHMSSIYTVRNGTR